MGFAPVTWSELRELVEAIARELEELGFEPAIEFGPAPCEGDGYAWRVALHIVLALCEALDDPERKSECVERAREAVERIVERLDRYGIVDRIEAAETELRLLIRVAI